MGVETLKIQLTLNADNAKELALIHYINESGKRSGVPKQLLLMGFDLIQNAKSGGVVGPAEVTTSKPALDQYIS
jgi:hypothetical protein